MFKRQNKNQLRTRRPYEQESQTGPVFSYYSNRSPRDDGSQRGVKERDKSETTTFLQRLPILLSLLAMAIAGVYLLTLTPRARIVITDDSKVLRAKSIYQAQADALLRDSPLNRFKLSFNSDTISQRMQQRFPELQRVTTTVPLITHRPVIEIHSVEPAFILESSSTNRYYMSYQGRAIANVSDITTPATNIATVLDQTNIPVNVGKQVLPSDLVTFIAATLSYLKAADIPVSTVILPSSANELHIRIAGTPYYVKFYTQGDARLQAGTFIATKKKMENDGVGVNEYIDVRVEERVYYK